jgi:hypothetical protein
MGSEAPRMKPTSDRRFCGHAAMGPGDVPAQSKSQMSLPVAPPRLRNSGIGPAAVEKNVEKILVVLKILAGQNPAGPRWPGAAP